MVMKGKAMKNADGSVDDWHEQKLFYGIAIADIFLACPATIAGIVMVFASPRWGYYILALEFLVCVGEYHVHSDQRAF